MIREEGIDMFITSGDDDVLLLYDMKKRIVVGEGKISTVDDLK